MDIVFVSMPMADVERPSIALGLLKAVLTQHGMDSRIFYGNVRYLDYFGPSAYRLSRVASPEEALVDWLFAPVAFPEHMPPPEDYLAALLTRNPHLGKADKNKIIGSLLELRRRTGEFVDWMVQAVLRLEPRIVGCTSMFQQHVASLALLPQNQGTRSRCRHDDRRRQLREHHGADDAPELRVGRLRLSRARPTPISAPSAKPFSPRDATSRRRNCRKACSARCTARSAIPKRRTATACRAASPS